MTYVDYSTLLKIHMPTRMYLKTVVLNTEYVSLVELCAATIPGISILVSDHFGSLVGREILENLLQLEVLHIRGQVTNKHGELGPVKT